MSPKSYLLKIEDFQAEVRLGCSEEERRQPQEVRFFCHLRFAEEPIACSSDRLEDTICYDRLTQILWSACQEKEFKTVEYLAQLCFERLHRNLPPSVKVALEVHKVRPPIENLKGGVRFRVEDL